MTRRRHPLRRADASELGPSTKERMTDGKALRERVSRASQALWKRTPSRPNPIELLKHADRGRLAELLPIRYGRMRKSPFAFFRGAAAVMAADLATTPSTRLRVQACGDCHVANFGGFGSPERRLVFDINDFDETLPAPWEWDVKRLGASIVLAGRELGLRERHCADTTRTAVRSYREHMRAYARMRGLDVWYSHLDAEIFITEAKTDAARKRWEEVEKNAGTQTAEHVFPRITAVKSGRLRIVDLPPLVYHPPEIARIGKHVRDMFERYRRSLPEERRVILDRYHVVDIARKVVGVGSVGTRCAVALLMAGAEDPLFLQFKEANTSVLAPYAGKSRYENQGERVVTGQRMLQSASDIFLGWARDDQGRDYYFRQLRDMRMKIDVTQMSRQDWLEYVQICGWTLARAHARTGDPGRIGGYLGKSEAFDRAIEKFAVAYADQTERDHAALLKAIRAGKIQARSDAAT
ncbi:MAG TPA: DUF2252 domain-containing protein [Candidatus Acidoferrales bacterium]|jgi:uncharacterized protein (DUF2252 family)|nr:DUF2252 domain-containing protein [Candidatus Acidoferrales bacterium]